MENYKIVDLSGIFWASDILHGQKPMPIQKKEKSNGDFKNLLDNEMEKLANATKH